MESCINPSTNEADEAPVVDKREYVMGPDECADEYMSMPGDEKPFKQISTDAKVGKAVKIGTDDGSESKSPNDASSYPNAAVRNRAKSFQVDNHESASEILSASLKYVLLRGVLIFGFYGVGYGFYKHYEDWGLLDSIYFITVTVSTVGYGDFYPTNDASRMFTIFYIIVGVAFIFSIVTDATVAAVEFFEKRCCKKTSTDGIDYRTKVGVAIGLMIIAFFLGALFYMEYEDWGFMEALYFCVVTTTTVGYGHLVPTGDEGKIFTICYIYFSIAIVSFAIGRIASAQIEAKLHKKEQEFMERQLDVELLAELDRDGNGIDKLEFIVGILTQLEVIDPARHIDPWIKKFEDLDVDGNGTLDSNDMLLMKSNLSRNVEKLQQAGDDESINDQVRDELQAEAARVRGMEEEMHHLAEELEHDASLLEHGRASSKQKVVEDMQKIIKDVDERGDKNKNKLRHIEKAV